MIYTDAHRQRTIDWIDGAGGLACAFDFTTKAILQVRWVLEVEIVRAESNFVLELRLCRNLKTTFRIHRRVL